MMMAEGQRGWQLGAPPSDWHHLFYVFRHFRTLLPFAPQGEGRCKIGDRLRDTV